MYTNNEKQKKIPHVETVSKFNIKIAERTKVDTTNTQIQRETIHY